jgi:hypothetical protein
MMSQIMAHTDLTIFARISLPLFLGIYLIALWRVLRPGAKKRHEELARTLLSDD